MVVREPSTVVYRSAADDAYWKGVTTGRVEAVTIAAAGAYASHKMKHLFEEDEAATASGGSIDFAHELAETRALMRELKAEIGGLDGLARAIDKPSDGAYLGESAEDDAGDQSVRTTLSFGESGSIVGDGFDGVDGLYTIREGRWSQKRVAWVEEYDEGFSVALRGQVRPDGTIVALWASSRGVGGSVSLMAPVR